MSLKFCEKCKSLIMYNHCTNDKCEKSKDIEFHIEGRVVTFEQPTGWKDAYRKYKELIEKEKEKEGSK